MFNIQLFLHTDSLALDHLPEIQGIALRITSSHTLV
nr:MAG TPA: hypothetical protein [Caudoviricetes sp.]